MKYAIDFVSFFILGVVFATMYLAFRCWRDMGFSFAHFNPRWIPTALVVIDVAAAIGYGVVGGATEWRKVVYWLAAGALTYTVTW